MKVGCREVVASVWVKLQRYRSEVDYVMNVAQMGQQTCKLHTFSSDALSC
jgi:hypothetical protein